MSSIRFTVRSNRSALGDRRSLDGVSLMADAPTEIPREFYENLGHAVSAWAHVEEGLFTVFWRLLGGADFNVLSAAFHSVVSFKARVDMVDAAPPSRRTQRSGLLMSQKASDC